MLKQFSTLW